MAYLETHNNAAMVAKYAKGFFARGDKHAWRHTRSHDKEMAYNGKFRFGNETFWVTVTGFGYGYSMKEGGSGGQARQTYTYYPKRVERGSVSISLIFPDMDEYIAFVEFIRACHVGMTSTNNPNMVRFNCSEVHGGATYSIIPPKVSASIRKDLVAPTLTLSGCIIVDYAGMDIADTATELRTVGNDGTLPTATDILKSGTGLLKADAAFR